MVSQNARLMAEWNYKKNNDLGLLPDQIGENSPIKAWWKCEFGHEWEARISNRKYGRGCPKCLDRLKTSFPEQAIYYYIKKIYPSAVSSYRDIFPNTMELDIFIPDIKLGIEYDGAAWHPSERHTSEVRKYQICRENGIKLLRVKEKITDFDKGSADYLLSTDNVYDIKNFESLIRYILDNIDPESNMWTRRKPIFHSQVDINILRDENDIRSYLKIIHNGSFADHFPNLINEWHPTKNGDLLPSFFAPHSSVKVWWKCNAGHEWKASIGVRARGSGCPYCSGQKVLPGYNDLATQYPDISNEWCYELNNSLLPTMVTGGSGKKVWWKCKEGHTWSSKINNRTINNRGCPYCSHERVISGTNDLATLYPEIASEWHPTKNGSDSPSDYLPFRNKKKWWLCSKCGYEYQAVIGQRVKGSGCKRCAGQVLIKGVNDFETLYPEIALEWDYEENIGLAPSDVFGQSNIKYHWKDKFGHKWMAQANDRANGTGCPYCSGNKVLKGFNDIKTTRPDLRNEWHPSKNGNVQPTDISKGYTKKVWWKCSVCGNDFEAYVGNRIKGHGCPYCSGRKPIKGKTDFLTIHPELLIEWDFEKNQDKDPTDYTVRSENKAWWKCKECGNSWQTRIRTRCEGHGCPRCAKRRDRIIKPLEGQLSLIQIEE